MKDRRLWIGAVILIAVLVFAILFLGKRKTEDTLNGDGIREDVAVEIARAFPKSEKRRAAATQLAAAFQRAIDMPDEALAVFDIYQRAKLCLQAIEESSSINEEVDSSQRIEGWVVNSLERSRAYIHYNAGLSGQFFEIGPDDISQCEFDPSAMEN